MNCHRSVVIDRGCCSVFIAFIALIAASLISIPASAQSSRDDRRQLAQLEEYCVACHNFEDYAGSLDLETILTDAIPQR